MSEKNMLLGEKAGEGDEGFFKIFGATKYPLKLSLSWRLIHATLYNIGGFTFLIGSLCYFPSLANYVVGGWLFTIGSTGFLAADVLEWYTNNRVGCWDNASQRADFEAAVGTHMESKETCFGQYQRAENGINFAFSAFGSTLYLIGSIMFIPSLDLIVLGTEVFIAGSTVIYLSQGWKVYRQGCFNESDVHDKSWSMKNYLPDIPALFVDAFAGFGGVFYFVGSIYFLPAYDITDADTIRAAAWFTAGGAAFTISALSIVYRYFFVHPPAYYH